MRKQAERGLVIHPGFHGQKRHTGAGTGEPKSREE